VTTAVATAIELGSHGIAHDARPYTRREGRSSEKRREPGGRMVRLANIETVREYQVNGPKSVELGQGTHLRCVAYFFKSGQRLGPTRHCSDTVMYVVRGRARIRIGDREEEGRAGDLFMAGDGDEVWIGNTGRDELILFAVAATVFP
jgi:mannose-6-phosphate isomerase-like protein (cupin superfamily)